MSAATSRTHKVLVYSNDAALRDTVRTALGRRPAADLGRLELVEAGTLREVLEAVDAGGVDVVVLDGEARPSGGFGISKQLKDELHDAPATLVLCKRTGDAWLASWALADATQPLPVDAPALCEAVVGLIRNLENGVPVLRAAAV
jgi:DNA-binding NtrC family response regulator